MEGPSAPATTKKKIAYFTVDDCPSKDMRQKVDSLVRRGIPSIWFTRAEFIAANGIQDIVHAIKNGCVIGNHSYSHPFFSKLTFDQCKEEIQKAEDLIEQAYSLAGVARPAKLFRFPFGDRGGGRNFMKKYKPEEQQRVSQLQAYLREQGFSRALFTGITYQYYSKWGLGELVDAPWTCDVGEYQTIWEATQKRSGLYTLADVLTRLDKHDPEHELGLHDLSSSEIILMHDFTETTAMWDPILDKLQTKPLEFRLPELEK